MSTAISVEHLSKAYRLGMIGGARLQEDVSRWWAKVRRKPDPLVMVGQEHHARRIGRQFWALDDVSFAVAQGEVLGIIGGNGAGKSTLLKILSQVTAPTSGRIRIKGRVSSLLEVGTGFHPDLSGRENVFLNGAIMGMTKAEIRRKLAEIIAFSEIEEFIDTPVKRYSSGMYVRLAFAVAAHLEPEVLIVDEVLAVGDSAFQKKCMGKMNESKEEGRTVLFVSHNMASVQHLCSRALLMKAGRLAFEGRPSEVIAHYLSDAHEASTVSIRDWQDRATTGEARIVQMDIMDMERRPIQGIPVGGAVSFSILAEFTDAITDPCFGVLVHNAAGDPLLDIRSSHDGLRLGRVQGETRVQVSVEGVGLYPGRYFLSPWITDSADTRAIDWVKLCCILHVYPAPGPWGDLRLDPKWGKYWIRSKWSGNSR